MTRFDITVSSDFTGDFIIAGITFFFIRKRWTHIQAIKNKDLFKSFFFWKKDIGITLTEESRWKFLYYHLLRIIIRGFWNAILSTFIFCRLKRFIDHVSCRMENNPVYELNPYPWILDKKIQFLGIELASFLDKKSNKNFKILIVGYELSSFLDKKSRPFFRMLKNPQICIH